MNCYQIISRIYPVANLYTFIYIPYKTEQIWWKFLKTEIYLILCILNIENLYSF